jgi:hypothetical protein
MKRMYHRCNESMYVEAGRYMRKSESMYRNRACADLEKEHVQRIAAPGPVTAGRVRASDEAGERGCGARGLRRPYRQHLKQHLELAHGPAQHDAHMGGLSLQSVELSAGMTLSRRISPGWQLSADATCAGSVCTGRHRSAGGGRRMPQARRRAAQRRSRQRGDLPRPLELQGGHAGRKAVHSAHLTHRVSWSLHGQLCRKCA